MVYNAGMENVLIISAEELVRVPSIDTAFALEVRGVNDDNRAAVAAKLKAFYGEREFAEEDGVMHLEALPLIKARYGFNDLMRVLARLTAPDGCPWDKVQTHESIRGNMIEEAYEAVDAVNRGSIADMREEFGDVLLQSALNCNIADRSGEFDVNDVTTALCEKLVSRHTHIFGNDRAADPEEALKFWERAKAEEKSYTSPYDQVSRMPENFPSLLFAQKTYAKFKKAGVEYSPERELVAALADGNLAAALFALCAMMKDEDKGAEVELRKYALEFANAHKGGGVE